MSLDRRDFLRVAAGAAAASLPYGCASPQPEAESAAAPGRPNIVLIMADDMGFSDIGPYGGEISTPNLDQLAANGVCFRQFYNAARCCPTRASLMTGLYPHQAGVGHMMEDYGLPAYRGSINDRCVTIAEALRPAGYTTLMSGKWHVTPPEVRDNWPRQRGYDHFFGTITGAGNFYNPATLQLDNEPASTADPEFYYTNAIGDHAVQFIAEAPTEKPFFLYMAFTAPHWPMQAPEADVARQKGKYDMGWDALREARRQRQIEKGVTKADWELTPRDSEVPAWEDAEDKAWQSRRMEVFAAMVEILDRNIGRVVDQLRQDNRFDNTLILFLADNGGCAETLSAPGRDPIWFTDKTRAGETVQKGNDPAVMPGPENTYQSYGPPWANASNTPFRLYKHWTHEGGISTPLIAHWPAGVKSPGTWSDEPGHLIDIMATCVDLSGGDYPAELHGQAIQPYEGRSLAPILRGEAPADREALYWEHEGNRAIRQGKWKLVSKYKAPENGRWELYDIDADRTEMHDLAAEMPDKVEQMSALWQTWADRVGVVPWQSWKKA
ncbi:MAG: sulfatase-like hydrolase/transferase [Acidobacteria bacterium]|nr:sulfatase-like hydrolase/transferase [Acidobacteriota bacterium]